MFLPKVTTTTTTASSSGGAPSIRLVYLFLLLFVSNPPHQKGNLLFVKAQTSTICNTKFEQVKKETGSEELTCYFRNLDDNDNEEEEVIGVNIQYGCEGLEPMAGITFNIECTGFTEQSATTTTGWFCKSFSDDYDFTILRQLLCNTNSFGLLCDDGTEPMFHYRTFRSSSYESHCPPDVWESSGSGPDINVYINFLNETLGYELTSITSSTDIYKCRPSICQDIWDEQHDHENYDIMSSNFICTTIDDAATNSRSTSTHISYGCEDGTQPSTISNSSLVIYADQQCTGIVQEPQTKERTLFDCIAFGTDTDSFTTLLMNIEESNLVCADGKDPVYTYRSYTIDRETREDGTEVASVVGDGTIFRNEFNITLANELYTLEQDVERYEGWPPSICNQVYIDENPEDDDDEDRMMGTTMTRSPLTCTRSELDTIGKTIGRLRKSDTTYIAFTCQDNDDDEMADDTPILLSDVSCTGVVTITEGNETTQKNWTCSAFAYDTEFQYTNWFSCDVGDHTRLCAEGSNPVFKYVGASTNVTQSSSDEINAMLAFGVYSSSNSGDEEEDAGNTPTISPTTTTLDDGTLDGGDEANSAASYFKFGSETNVLATMGMTSGAMILFLIIG